MLMVFLYFKLQNFFVMDCNMRKGVLKNTTFIQEKIIKFLLKNTELNLNVHFTLKIV